MPPSPFRSPKWILQLAGWIALAAPAAWAGQSPEETRMNCGARIDCVTPDGQQAHVAKLPASDPGAAALIMEDDTITCLLQEGRTDFVVELPKTSQLDRLTFLNENAVARGELKIAVSNERLKADSAGWVEVEGIVPFSHKRLFGVSLVGIEAKFVRLSFQVEKPGRVAALAKAAVLPEEATPAVAAREITFTDSALQEALDSKFAMRNSRDGVVLTASAVSVGPLSANEP